MRKAVALLPMKAHSERVPNKNVRLLAGKPLFCHIADTLFASMLFDRLCINTDSEQIMEAARKKYPAEWLVIHERPKALCGDHVPMNHIIADDLERLGLRGNYLQTHSTNPFVTVKTLQTAYARFIHGFEEGFDSLFSVTKYQARFFDKDFNALNHDPGQLIRTQDLPPVYEENSCFYLFTYDSFNKKKSRVGKKPQYYVVNAGCAEFLDIDTQQQWHLAEAIANQELKNS